MQADLDKYPLPCGRYSAVINCRYLQRELFPQMIRALEPGGVLGVIDHAGDPGADNAKLHRIEESLVVASAQAAGFEVEARGDMLRSSSDDRSKNVFAPEVRGRTDRFVLRLRKPR